MKHKDPKQAAEIVNKVGKLYDLCICQGKRTSNEASAYIETQMAKEKEQLDEALVELKQFLSQPKGVSELSNELNARLSQVTEYKTKRTDLEIQREGLRASIEVAEKVAPNTDRIIIKPSAQGNANSIMVENSVQSLQIDLAQVESNIKTIQEKIEETQKLIEELQVELEETT